MDDAAGGGLRVRLRQIAPIPLDLEFTCASGALTALFGPSGSGKTTVLRSIAGLHTPFEASIRCAGETWCDTATARSVPAHRRSVGFVFQDYALFPHMTVREQLLAAMAHLPDGRRAGRLERLLALAHLSGLEERRPAALSGGQQQRVAIARALARDPAVLLLDEPFASVDRALRDALHREFLAVRRELRIPIVLVTHDFEDVTRLASDLIVLEHGRAVASGTVSALTAANALPGIAAWREPGVALDAAVVAHDPSRALSTVRAGELSLLVPAIDARIGAQVRVQIPAREVILATSRPAGLSLHNAVDAGVLAVEAAAHPGLAVIRL
ncbi:MAG: molybdenum ABC transporter ATP-binding protein, partial [Gammaproteobacteria bacterium]